MITKSKDLLINWNRTPDEKSQEFLPFWANERKKCKEGISIDGVFINPFLYWHCNLWTIITDHITRGRIKAKPSFRDSEWVLTNRIWEAETWVNEEGLLRRKGVVAAGARRYSKSVLEASFCAWKACNWRNSQIVVSGGNEPDIKIITDMLDLGINELPEYYVKSKVEDNWKKQVSLGFKDKETGERNIWSSFAIRNFDGGNNEEALAGLTPFGGIIDEAGKYSFLKALIAGLPGLTTPNGWRGSFLVMGTGGDMDNFQDFQTLFDDPESYNFLACDLPEENRSCGIFLPGWMSYAYPKKESNLGEYLGKDSQDCPNLSNVKMLVANREENEKLIDDDRLVAAKSNDPAALLKTTMYFPKNTREIFLSPTNNNFPIEAAKQHQFWLRENYQPICVDLYRDKDNIVRFKESIEKPIYKFPVDSADYKIAPICIYEFPQSGLDRGVYCMGVDSYNSNESSDRINSLGSIHIVKRIYDPLGEFQNCIVASYSGRPALVTDFYKICYDLAEFYNAYILPEHNQSFIDYFINRKKGYLLWDTPQLAVDIRPMTKVSRGQKGLPPTTTNQRFYMDKLVTYTTEELIIPDRELGEKQVLGITRIKDVMLLEEMIQYRTQPASSKGIHGINVDRIVSAGHAFVLANHLDKYLPITGWKAPKAGDDDENNKKPIKIKTPFGTVNKQNSPFITPGKRKSSYKGNQFI